MFKLSKNGKELEFSIGGDSIDSAINILDSFKNDIDFDQLTGIIRLILVSNKNDVDIKPGDDIKIRANEKKRIQSINRALEKAKLLEKEARETVAEFDPEYHPGIDYLKKTLTRLVAEKTYIKKPDSIIQALDKVNDKLYKGVEVKNNSIRLQVDTAKQGSNMEVIIPVHIEFNKEDLRKNGIAVTSTITVFDERVCSAIHTFYKNGYTKITLSQIYKLFNGGKNPGKSDIKKINDSITKLSSAHLYIDNIAEVEAEYNYKRFKYDSNFLMIRRIQEEDLLLNGQLVEAYIEIVAGVPLIEFSEARKQFTLIPASIYNAPVSKTDSNLAIENYLIKTIARTKISKKIKIETIAKDCKIQEKKQIYRLTHGSTKDSDGIITRFLNYYKKEGFISNFKYSEDNKAITIYRSTKKEN